MPAHLILHQEEDETSAYPLDKPIMVLGRADDCDIVLRQTMKLSRRHCCVAQVNGKLVIRDLGSMNGLKVNGTRSREQELKEGDEITLGDLLLTFTLKALPKKSAPPKSGSPSSSPDKSKKSGATPPRSGGREKREPLNEADRETPLKSSGSRSRKALPVKESVQEPPEDADELLDSGDLDVEGLEEA